jgi:hypothetical protein
VGPFLEYVAEIEGDRPNAPEGAHAAATCHFRDAFGLDIGPLPMPEPPRLVNRFFSCGAIVVPPPVAERTETILVLRGAATKIEERTDMAAGWNETR